MNGPPDLRRALQPLLDRVGGQLVADDDIGPEDIPIAWPIGTVLHVRLNQASLQGALTNLLNDAEAKAGRPLPLLSRFEKRDVIRSLRDHGAFEMRRSAEIIAEALGITRYTVYKYLKAHPPQHVSARPNFKEPQRINEPAS